MKKKSNQPMPNTISALTARTQFGQILKRVSEKGERFLVGRRGEPKAIIMGITDFIDTLAPPPEFLKEIWAEAKRKRLNRLTIREIDAEIQAYRRKRIAAARTR